MVSPPCVQRKTKGKNSCRFGIYYSDAEDVITYHFYTVSAYTLYGDESSDNDRILVLPTEKVEIHNKFCFTHPDNVENFTLVDPSVVSASIHYSLCFEENPLAYKELNRWLSEFGPVQEYVP